MISSRSRISEALTVHPANDKCNFIPDSSQDRDSSSALARSSADAYLSELLMGEAAACASSELRPVQQQHAADESGGWCVEEGLLARIFNGFPHLQTSSSQAPSDVLHLAKIFQEFILSHSQRNAKVPPAGTPNGRAKMRGPLLWSDISAASLQALAAAAAITTSKDLRVKWFPEYGSAILAMPLSAGASEATGLDPDIRARQTQVSLALVGLDNWESAVRSYLGSTGVVVERTAECRGHSLVMCGTLETDDFTSGFTSQLARVEAEHAKLLGKSGPRTPGYLQALVVEALQGGDASNVRACGGFTDVGQHQGFSRRDTCWPLVREVLKVCLEQQDGAGTQVPAYLFDQAMTHFQLWLCARQAQLIGGRAEILATPVRLSACMHMLHTAASSAAVLAEAGHDTAAIELTVRAIRRRLDGAAGARADAKAAAYQLPHVMVRNTSSAYRLPYGELPPAVQLAEDVGGLAAARIRAAENLGSLPMLQGDAVISYRQLLLAVSMPTWSNVMESAAAQLALRSVERELFSQATQRGFDELTLGIGDEELTALEAVVDEYRSLLRRFLDTEAGRAGMRVELLSRELLVVWVGYCLLHAAARQRHSEVMAPTGVALLWEDLRHLVLSDKEAVDAALAVSAYLHEHARPGSELFSQRDAGSATFKMAQNFVAQDSGLMQIWREEQRVAAKRKAAHWKEVQRKQREVASLRVKLKQLNHRELDIRHKIGKEYERHDRGSQGRFQAHQTQLRSLQRDIVSTQGLLTLTEVAPVPVFQPLPQGEPRAQSWLSFLPTLLGRPSRVSEPCGLHWLFFLHMPPLFRLLSRCSFLAQQMLLPLPPSEHAQVWEAMKVKPWKISLVQHYNKFREDSKYADPAKHDPGADGCVSLHSRQEIPRKVGPDVVDSFASAEDGVWYPDTSQAAMAWEGSSSSPSSVDTVLGISCVGFFDPFASVEESVIEQSFTEGSSNPHQLQWAMHTHKDRHSTPPDRGNLAIAKQADKPFGLSKPAFLALGTLRAYPLGQMHRLCDLLHQREVPLHGPEVSMLVRQAVFHIGTLGARPTDAAPTSPPELLWRTDWQSGTVEGGDVLATVCFELQRLAEELDQSPRDHDAVLLLGELAAYFSMWHAPCESVARRFADMTRRAADVMDDRIAAAAAAGDAIMQKLQARQCQLRMLSLLCYGPGALHSAGDAAAVVQLIVQIKHGHVFLDKLSKEESAELRSLHSRCHNVTARHAVTLVRLTSVPGGQRMLTAAVSSVLRRAPATLKWQRLGDSASGMDSGSFEAVDAEGHLYSVNMLDGTVLLDGNPPGRLPNGVMAHPLYCRVFGKRNFEVSCKAGVFQTQKPVNNCLYDFCLVKQQLTVIETDEKGHRLELLDGGEDQNCGKWGSDLPIRLRELHSHWLCRERGVILLRPQAFQEHACSFLVIAARAKSEEEEGRGNKQQKQQQRQYTCWRVPPHLQQLPTWLDLMGSRAHELTDQLVLPDLDSRIKRVLSKVETPQLIHTFLGTMGSAGSGTGSGPSFGTGSDTGSGTGSGTSSCTAGDVTVAALPRQQVLLWELPRYGLVFEQDRNGLLVSRDYHGYQLTQCQQLATGLLDPQSHLPSTGLPGESDPRDGSSMGMLGGCKTGCVVDGREDGINGHRVGSPNTPGFWYTLPEFEQYLVLERGAGLSSHTSSCARRADLLVLVPSGGVERKPGSSQVRVMVPDNVDATVEAHSYEVHARFGDLRASSRLARLQLAALYAASSSLMPEPLSQRTGAQTAMQLLRQCWGNSPLAPQERCMLGSVAQLGGQLAAGLGLLVRELHLSATQLAHLHPASLQLPMVDGVPQLDVCDEPPGLNPNDGNRYLHESKDGLFKGWCSNAHMLLTDAEEIRSMGVRRKLPREVPSWFRTGSCRTLEVQACPVDASFVDWAEREIMDAVAQVEPTGDLRPYPLQPGADADLSLRREMDQELRGSWDVFCRSPKDSVVVAPDELQRKLCDLQGLTHSCRTKAESYLMHSLSRIPPETSHGAAYRMLRLSGATPWPSQLDLAACYVADTADRLRCFNPFLSDAACGRLWEGVGRWLQLCVLEDRLERLQALLEAGEEMQPFLLRELKVHRTWDPEEHPEWLVLEAEGQLQIRPNQYVIAKNLMSERGTIDQLNMGEGKTRVIMPMLVLHWTRLRAQVVRLHLLSPLLDETHGYLQRFMCASVLGRKIFTLPFHRDVDITERGARAMKACLQYCQQVGGILLVAPEQRASLSLKWHELRAKGESGVCLALDELAALPYQDLLDESDELLHHRFQLVYACGSASGLPAFRQRASAIQALLHLVSDKAEAWLDSALWTSSQNRCPGSFCGLRLLPGPGLDAAVPPLYTNLANALFDNPPYELRWMKGHPVKAEILTCMLDGSKDALLLLGPDRGGLTDDQVDHVLAIRGMLSSGLLVHGLQKRHLVEYGVNRTASARKSLAVPFRAAHTPSERSEFAQPDVALVLTNLAYYHGGLNPVQLLQALQKLLGFGQSAQEHHYAEWFKLSSDAMDADDRDALDMVSKLDPSNALQLELLFRYYSHNMALIDFWLNFCVLPSETQQYPQRLAASSWHLVENERRTVAGFSGTNDNHRLLPLQVRQALQPDKTNGEMLAVVMDHCKGYSTLKDEKPTWQALLDEALALQLDAILDCGALLAGTSNRHAAEYLVGHLDPGRHRGVGFFDEVQRTWMVLEVHGRCLPRHASPVADSQAFLIYDDARCRGADLQLRPPAVGLLTLGPAICKDKMMQAAGRLRMLGRGQKLHFVATADVTAKILSTSGLGPDEAPAPVHVLQWVRDNTVQMTQKGVLEWSQKGLSFACTFKRPDAVIEDEILELEELYGAGRTTLTVSSIVHKMSTHRRVLEAQDGSQHAVRRAKVVEEVVSRSRVMGSDHQVVVGTAVEEECERELEREEEEEQEVEREVERVCPGVETDWDYETVLDASSLDNLDPQAKPTPLSKHLASMQMDMLRSLDWAPQLYCTANFMRTVADGPDVQEMYLRPVKALLLLPNGTVLLVSERESDALLELRCGAVGGGPADVQCSASVPLLITCLAYAQLVCERSIPQRLTFPLSASRPQAVASCPVLLQPGVKELVSMMLFDGGTQYRTPEQLRELHRLMRRKKRAAEALTDMRGKQSMLPRSHLELACEDVLYETAFLLRGTRLSWAERQ